MIDKKIYKVGLMLCDESGFLSLKNLLSLMLDVTFDQARRVEKNLGMDKLFWLLYSWDIYIDEPIKENDIIEVITIPTHMKRFYAYRDFFVKKNGKIITRALGKFILFDLEKKRPIIIDEKIEKAYGKEKQIIEEKKIKKEKDFDKNIKVFVRKADKDTNGHVNNAVYFDYLKEMDGFSDKKVSYIKLIYKNEIRKETDVDISYKNYGKECIFSLDSLDKNHSYGKIIYV